MRHFKFSNFNAERRGKLSADFKKIAIVKFGLAGALSLVNPFLGLWLATAGVIAGCFAGGVDLSDRVLRSKAKSNFTKFQTTNTRFRAVDVFRRTYVHNHARAYHRGASSTMSAAGGNSDGGSDPDQGEPPDPDNPFFLSDIPTHRLTFFKTQKNSFMFLRRIVRGLGSCCVPTHQRFEGVAA